MKFTIEQLRPFLRKGAEEELERAIDEHERTEKESRRMAEPVSSETAERLSEMGFEIGSTHTLKVRRMGRTPDEEIYVTCEGVLKDALFGTSRTAGFDTVDLFFDIPETGGRADTMTTCVEVDGVRREYEGGKGKGLPSFKLVPRKNNREKYER